MSTSTKTKARVSKVIDQARNQAIESFKLLEALEKEAVSKAKTLVSLPNSAARKKLTNDRILRSLKKLGVATQSEVSTLEARITKLESLLALKTNSPVDTTLPRT
jgi:polyhydroxyalkanoate synthesis regulator phasin